MVATIDRGFASEHPDTWSAPGAARPAAPAPESGPPGPLRRGDEPLAPGLPPVRHPEALILAVDDQPANLVVLERLLRRAGYRRVLTTTDSRETAALVRRHHPDLLLLDWHMPAMDGLAVLHELAPQMTGDAFFPVIILSADPSPEAKALALSRGASDFVMKPFDAAEVILRTRNLLEMRRLQGELRRQNQELEERLRIRAQALEEAHAATLERLARAVECRDDETGQHTHRVGDLSGRIAKAMGLPEHQVRLLRRAAPLHDVGKIGIPDAVLHKPGPLTAAEFAVMARHAEIGAQLLGGTRSPITELARRIARSHHERWDGTGYPDRLAGADIPLEARIVAVADFYDALTSDRPYRRAWSHEQARAAVLEGSGTHFDPTVVAAFQQAAPSGPAAS